jgi:hypothetical protein
LVGDQPLVLFGRRSCFCSASKNPSDVDEVVADYAQSKPTLHAAISLVPAAVESVAALDHADAPFTTGPPFSARCVGEPQSWDYAPGFPGGGIWAQQDVVQLADGLNGFFQFLVIAQPLAHLRNLFAVNAELAGAAAGIADGENGLRMSFPAGALGAAAGMAGDALDEGSAQDLAGDG